MADISNWRIAPIDRYYLDTSAIFALSYPTAISAGLVGREANAAKQASRATPFVGQAVKAGATVFASVLGLEEVAAATRNKSRTLEAQAKGFRDWQDCKRSGGSASRAVDQDAQRRMMAMLGCALSALRTNRVTLVEPEVDDPTVAADERVKNHHDLLRTYAAIDPMDALHIVLGIELDVTAFVSFDNGWQHVRGIKVLA